MAKAREQKHKAGKPGRNDPCWCGSGKKYKECHLPIEDAWRSELRGLRQAQDTLLPKIMDAAQQVPQSFPQALELFWNGAYTMEQMGELDDLEDRGSDRFLTWAAFDHRLADGRTLVETLTAAAEQGEFEADESERRLLQAWQHVRLRPYAVEQMRKGKGFTVRDLLSNATYEVEEHAASKRLLEDEVIVGHLVPVGLEPQPTPEGEPEPPEWARIPPPVFYVAGAMAHLTSDTQEKIVEFAGLHLEDLRRTQPDATLDDLPRERSHVFNHFVMELPEEHTPGLLDDVLLRTRMALSLAGLPTLGGSTEHRDDAEK
jgi:uncharacterized protein YecA (UPF0149 family)